MPFIQRYSDVKKADKAYAVRGDYITYTSVITNTGSVPVTDVFFKDEIPAGTAFTVGSVYINEVNFPAYDPQTGFPLPDLAAGQSVTVEFDVKVN